MNILIIIVALGIFFVVGTLVVVLLLKSKKPAVKEFDTSGIMKILDKNNIKSIDFIRNKIVIDFLNIDFFNPEDLQECGAKGISIVGDKIKFFVDGTTEQNLALFQQLKKHIEG